MKDIYTWAWIVLLVIVLEWVQYLWFRMKIQVLEFKVRYVQADLNMAREVLKRHPQDALEYVNLAQEACKKVK